MSENNTLTFTVVGAVTLMPLAVVTALVASRKRVPTVCRLINLCTTIILVTSVAALVVCYVVLGPRNVELARGDQIVFGSSSNGFLINADHFRSFACRKLALRSSKLGVIMWAVSVSLNRGQMANYTLTLQEWMLPNYIRLRLNAGDLINVRNMTVPLRAVWLKGFEAWKKWSTSGLQKLGYEKCCAWNEIELRTDPGPVKIDSSDTYTIILRYDDLQRSPKDVNTTVHINLQRIRLAATPCDPIICDGQSESCETDNTPQLYVIDFAVQTQNAPPYETAQVRITCQIRYWAIGLIFGTIPVIIILLILLVWRLRERSKKLVTIENKMEKDEGCMEIRARGERSNYGGRNPAFELDIV